MKVFPQWPGDPGVMQTVRKMKTLINQSSIHPLIRKQAFMAISNCNKLDNTCKAYSILAFAKNHISYINDPTAFELLQDPRLFAKAIDTGRRPYGDCDDFSMYIAALAKSVGMKPRLKIIGIGNTYHHVYVLINNILMDGTNDLIDEPFYSRGFEVNV